MSPTSVATQHPHQPDMSPSASGTIDVMVKLVSQDGKEFSVEEPIVLQSRVLSMFLSPGTVEHATRTIRMIDISASTLARVIDYLRYRKKYENHENPPGWDIKAEESMELLLVADYLEI